MDPQEYGLQILNKGAKTIQWEKTVFSAKMLEQLDTYMQKNEILDTDFTPFTKINSKWIIVQNVKCKTIKLPDDTRENPGNLRLTMLLDTTLNIQSMKDKRVDL